MTAVYSTTIHGATHLLDDDEGRPIWIGPVPTCGCGSPLLRDGATNRPDVSHVGPFEQIIGCDCCGATYPLTEN